MNAERLRAIEELAAHQAKTIEELSDEVARQSETIRLLQRRLDALVERFLAMEESASGPAEARKPPHW